MNIIDKIKLGWKGYSFVQEEIKEVTKMDSASGKPGWKTSEFWFHLATQASVLWGTVQGFVPPKYAAIIAVVGASVYNIGCIIRKAVSDIQATKANSTTVTTTEPVTTVQTPAQ